MTGQRRRFPRNARVVQLEIMADELRQWAGEYDTIVKEASWTQYGGAQWGRIRQRAEKLPAIAELLEKAALEIYSLW